MRRAQSVLHYFCATKEWLRPSQQRVRCNGIMSAQHTRSRAFILQRGTDSSPDFGSTFSVSDTIGWLRAVTVHSGSIGLARMRHDKVGLLLHVLDD